MGRLRSTKVTKDVRQDLLYLKCVMHPPADSDVNQFEPQVPAGEGLMPEVFPARDGL